MLNRSPRFGAHPGNQTFTGQGPTTRSVRHLERTNTTMEEHRDADAENRAPPPRGSNTTPRRTRRNSAPLFVDTESSTPITRTKGPCAKTAATTIAFGRRVPVLNTTANTLKWNPTEPQKRDLQFQGENRTHKTVESNRKTVKSNGMKEPEKLARNFKVLTERRQNVGGNSMIGEVLVTPRGMSGNKESVSTPRNQDEFVPRQFENVYRRATEKQGPGGRGHLMAECMSTPRLDKVQSVPRINVLKKKQDLVINLDEGTPRRVKEAPEIIERQFTKQSSGIFRGQGPSDVPLGSNKVWGTEGPSNIPLGMTRAPGNTTPRGENIRHVGGQQTFHLA